MRRTQPRAVLAPTGPDTPPRCDGCGRGPRHPGERTDIATAWILPGTDGPVIGHFCRDCAPTGPVLDLTCSQCGDGPLLAGDIAETPEQAAPLLTAAGWHLTAPRPARPAPESPLGSPVSAASERPDDRTEHRPHPTGPGATPRPDLGEPQSKAAVVPPPHDRQRSIPLATTPRHPKPHEDQLIGRPQTSRAAWSSHRARCSVVEPEIGSASIRRISARLR